MRLKFTSHFCLYKNGVRGPLYRFEVFVLCVKEGFEVFIVSDASGTVSFYRPFIYIYIYIYI